MTENTREKYLLRLNKSVFQKMSFILEIKKQIIVIFVDNENKY